LSINRRQLVFDPSEGGAKSRAEAASYVTQKYGFPCSKQTLAKLAVKGQGPEFKRANGRFAVYPVAGLDAWAATRIAE
jgi:hypothetical protein